MYNIAVIGLGLIGGSVAKAIKRFTKYTVYGYDIREEIMTEALKENAIDYKISDNLEECNIIILSLFTNGTIEFIKENLKKFKKKSIIIDTAGVKTKICAECSELCALNDLYFIGGHPMAGIEQSGFKHSTSDLFIGANMVFCRDKFTDLDKLSEANELFKEIGFGRLTYASPTDHDKIISYTSQLAHVVSNAYVQSETAKMQSGFSGGSYKDLTRVAYLNEVMWSELFIENKGELVREIRELSQRLELYAKFIEDEDVKSLESLLKRGKDLKVLNG